MSLKTDKEKELTMALYHELNGIHEISELEKAVECAEKMVKLLNEYNFTHDDCIKISKQFALNIIFQGVKGFIEYKEKDNIYKFREEMK